MEWLIHIMEKHAYRGAKSYMASCMGKVGLESDQYVSW